MGTEVQLKSYMPGYYSMRDLNEDLNGCSNWPLHYRERCLPNGQVYSHSLAGADAGSCFDYDKDAVKQKMLEHEAIFKKQVYELHRLYRTQKDLMDEIRRKELASSTLASECFLSDDARKLQSPGFVSNCGRPSISGSEASCSSMKSLTGHSSPQSSYFQLQNGCTSKVPEWLESRPSKVRRRMFDLTLPADKYFDPAESEPFKGESYDRHHKAVVDLNQPINVEDDNMPIHHPAHSLFDNGKILNKELSSSSQCWSSNGTLSNRHTDTNGSGKGWISHVSSAGHNYGDRKHASESKNQGISTHLPAHTLNDRTVSCTTDWTKLYSHPLASQLRPGASASQKSISFEARPHPGSHPVHRTSIQPPPLDHGMLGERCHQSNGGPGAGLGNKLPFDRNGLFIVSSSRGQQGISTWCDDRNSIDVKPSAVMDLNRVISDGRESKEDHFAVLPWLKANTSRKEKAIAETTFDFKEKIPLQSSTNLLTGRAELGEYSSNIKNLGIPITRDTHMPIKESSLAGKSEFEGAKGGKTTRMLDINLPCDQVSELSNSVHKGVMVLENKELSSKISGLNCQIDLNSCTDEGETFALTAERATGRKISMVIDLEAPPFPEMEEEEVSSEDEKHIQPSHREMECRPDETIKIAAEAMVAISSAVPDLPKPSSAENLEWFASIVVKERQLRNCRSSSEGIDYFESMTLKLTAMKDEEHLSQPLAPPETLKLREEDSAAATSAAKRRPQRKGRQRRDFQRDILPGLASLSRHEVMEDMQMFGGLMRATGHTWNCGPTRHGSARNGPARPRRRKVTGCPSPPVPSHAFTPPVNLTGWGKARRPRRQRCPAAVGNPQSIQLT